MSADENQLARRTFDCIADMKRANSPADLSARAAPLFADLGLPFFALARFFRPDRAPDVSVLAGSFQPDWSSRYVANGYGSRSLIVREMLGTKDPYSWGDVMRRRPVDEHQMRIKAEAGDFGLADGLFTPVRWVDGSYAAVVLAGPAPDLEDSFVRTSAGILSGFYAAEARRLAPTSPGATPLLSHRQRECLAWVRQGKSSATISTILGLSVQTVDEHLAAACRKLGVRTRVQAAVEASLAGLID
jgi:DNA-binding CsgD family transcriptional regulator